MSTDAFKHKRPFSPDEETDELIRHWQTPDMTPVHDGIRTNALNKTQPQAKASTADEDEKLTIKPLTADEIEQIRQAAYEEGFGQGKDEGFSKGYAEGREQGLLDGMTQGQAEGKKQGLAEGQTELNDKLVQLTTLLDQLQQPLASIDKQVKQQLLQLSLAMAQAVINVEVKTNHQVILQAISEATSALPLQAGQLVIKLNPADLAIVEQNYTKDELTQRNWQFRAEPLLEQGGCVVESSQSSVDRSLQQRIQGSLEHFIQIQQHDTKPDAQAEE